MSQVLEKPILLDETGQEIVDKLDEIKAAIGTSGEFIPISIRVSTPPTKTAYRIGEHLDLTGMVVNLVGSTGIQVDVTSSCTFSPANGATITANDTAVTITYLYQKDNITFTTTQALTIRELSSIAITSAPTKTAYYEGEELDLTGLVVTATYDDGTTADITNVCTYNPADGTPVTSADTTVSISYTESGITKTASQSITVKALSSITITTPPTTVDYTKGDTLDLTGMMVVATFDDSSTSNVTSECTYVPANGTVLDTSNTSIVVSYTVGSTTKTATQAITVLPPIYGVEWDGTASTTLSRTDKSANFVDPVPYYSGMSGTPSSPFDNIMPWSGMVTEERPAGTMVKIPKFWYKLTQNGSSLKIQISPEQMTGFSVSPAHMDRGDGKGECDFVYVGRYHCGATARKSVSGQMPHQFNTNKTFGAAFSDVIRISDNTWVADFAIRFTIWLLYIVEYANWDSQSVIGGGCGNNSSAGTMGYTDSMPYHTGTTQTSRATYGLGTQYRHIEGLWDNVWDWEPYAGTTSSGFSIRLTDLNGIGGGIDIGYFPPNYPSGLNIYDVTGAFPMFLPSSANGSDSTYLCDMLDCNTNSGYMYLFGGSFIEKYNSFKPYGLFTMGLITDNDRNNSIGLRAMELYHEA